MRRSRDTRARRSIPLPGPLGISRIVGLVALLVSTPAWDGADGRLLGQDSTRVTPEAAARLAPALRSLLPSIAPDRRLPVIVEFAVADTGPPPAGPGDVGPHLRRRSAEATSAMFAIVGPADPSLEVLERLWVVPGAVAEATPDAILRLASSPAVERIWLDEPLAVQLPPAASRFAEPAYTSEAMRTIGADAVWPAGVTGAGTTVAFFDSGVDGTNAMLASRWRGRRTDSRSAWFDPFRGGSAPQDLNGHGTQVAVAAVGALPAGDTLRLPEGGLVVASSGTDVVTGPAPEAEWIAARVFDTLAGGVYTRRSVLLQAFQWAIDPDNDPGTDDAPDVINASWGLVSGLGGIDLCEDLLYDAVDAAEAAGIAVLFATGNSGPAPGSVAAPAARDDPALRSFGVGATEGTGSSITVAPYSGRGPSPCGGGVKPEVAAPGRVPEVVAMTDGTARLTGRANQGTSFSVAQASGTIALLRQLRPGDSPQTLKQALIDTAMDLDPLGPDNDTGHGLVDVPAAVTRVQASFAGPLLQLAGAQKSDDGVSFRIRNRSAREWPGGNIRVDEVQPGGADVRLAAAAMPPIGPFGSMVVDLKAEGANTPTLRVTVQGQDGETALHSLVWIAPPNAVGGFVLQDGSVRIGMNDFGRLGGVAALPGFEWGGLDLLTAGGLGISTSDRVSDGFYVTTLGRTDQKRTPAAIDTDWAPRRALTSVEGAAAEAQFDDFDALEPLEIEVRAEMEAIDGGTAGALIYIAWITNRSGTTIPALVPSLLADWDLPGGETVRWSAELGALLVESRSGSGPVAVLAGDAQAVVGSDVALGLPGPVGFYEEGSGVLWDVFREEDKLALIGGLTVPGLPGASTATDRATLVALPASSLAPGESVAARFWLLAAQDETAAAQLLDELRVRPIEPPDGGDGEFAVDAPYPNPFVPGDGLVRFPVRLPAGTASALTLEIYDVAGRRLYERRVSTGSAGSSPVLTWDGLLDGGRPAAAGIYMYVVRLDGQSRTGRLILVR